MAWVDQASFNFDVADTPLNSGNWSAQTGESDVMAVVSFTGQPNNATVDCTSVYTARSWAADQSSRASFNTEGGSDVPGAGVGVSVRCDTASRSKYRLVIADSAWELGRNSPGFTSLASGTTTYVADAVLELRVVGTGTSTVLTVIYNGSTLSTFSDNGGSALNSGSAGISYSSEALGSLDNWVGAELLADPVVVAWLRG